MAEDENKLRRLYPRLHVLIPCRLLWQDYRVFGTTVDVSYTGVAVSLPKTEELRWKETVVHIPDGIVLRALPVHIQHRVEGQRVGFKVVIIESGDLEWKKLCYVPQW